MKRIHFEIVLTAVIVLADIIAQSVIVRDYLIGFLILSQVVLLGLELKTKLGVTLALKSEAIRRKVSASTEIVNSEDSTRLSKVAV